MESELQKFRRKKQIDQKKEEIKEKFKTTANSWARTFYEALLPSWNEDEEEDGQESSDTQQTAGLRNDDQDDQSIPNASEDNNTKNKWLLYAVTFLRLLTWFLAYLAFLKIGFGAVFFTISLLIFIYLNTRKSRRKKKGEVSAYSVFNKDCQSIDGTLKAEHLERQLLYRSS